MNPVGLVLLYIGWILSTLLQLQDPIKLLIRPFMRLNPPTDQTCFFPFCFAVFLSFLKDKFIFTPDVLLIFVSHSSPTVQSVSELPKYLGQSLSVHNSLRFVICRADREWLSLEYLTSLLACGKTNTQMGCYLSQRAAICLTRPMSWVTALHILWKARHSPLRSACQRPHSALLLMLPSASFHLLYTPLSSARRKKSLSEVYGTMGQVYWTEKDMCECMILLRDKRAQ